MDRIVDVPVLMQKQVMQRQVPTSQEMNSKLRRFRRCSTRTESLTPPCSCRDRFQRSNPQKKKNRSQVQLINKIFVVSVILQRADAVEIPQVRNIDKFVDVQVAMCGKLGRFRWCSSWTESLTCQLCCRGWLPGNGTFPCHKLWSTSSKCRC